MLELTRSKTFDEALAILTGRRNCQQDQLEHFNARSVEEALELLGEYRDEAKIIGGGVDLVSLMRHQLMSPSILVNIKTIPGLSYIKESGEGIHIGPLTAISEIELSPLILSRFPLIAQAAHSIGAPQVRNMGTIAGNLCQQVRCWYYRRSPVTGRTFHCLRKGGEHCYAVDGENAYHGIFGERACNAVCPSDLAPALVALNAKVKVVSEHAEKIIPLEEFFSPLGNILQPDELITEIQVPFLKVETKQRYLKFREREAIDFAVSSVAAVICLEYGIVRDIGIVLGGVAATPYRAIVVEDKLRGSAFTPSAVAGAAEGAVAQATPLSKNGHKVAITRALIKRALVGS